jgi:hypothetical protein
MTFLSVLEWQIIWFNTRRKNWANSWETYSSKLYQEQVSTTTGEESKLKCLYLINICLVIWQFSHGLDLWYTTREGLNPTS